MCLQHTTKEPRGLINRRTDGTTLQSFDNKMIAVEVVHMGDFARTPDWTCRLSLLCFNRKIAR